MATKKTAGSPPPPPAPKRDPNAGKAPTSTRSLWKGAISFGLVHVPIALYSATDESDLSFKMLDKRSMDPVGYKRINKKSGKEVGMADIVKGIEWEDGRFVLLSPEEIEKAYPKTTQTIEIEAFVPIDDIPFVYLEKPYYTAPVNRGAKVYALLREALAASRKVGVAKVVIANKQHLALLMPCGPALVLNLLRWGGEIRSWEALQLPPNCGHTAVSACCGLEERKLANQLCDSEGWELTAGLKSTARWRIWQHCFESRMQIGRGLRLGDFWDSPALRPCDSGGVKTPSAVGYYENAFIESPHLASLGCRSAGAEVSGLLISLAAKIRPRNTEDTAKAITIAMVAV